MRAEFTPDELRQIDAYASSPAAAKTIEEVIAQSRQAAGLPVAAPITYDENDVAAIEAYENGPLADRLLGVMRSSSGRKFNAPVHDRLIEVFDRCRG